MYALPEYWLRGPVPAVPPLLQPVAHALLQARVEVCSIMEGFPGSSLWIKPNGLASVGFHLQHLAGVLDRLFTYAKGKALDSHQLLYLSQEGKETSSIEPAQLVQFFSETVDRSIAALSVFDESELTQTRLVGRKQVPSTVIGLLFHAAEHTMRHTGQLIVTVNWVRN